MTNQASYTIYQNDSAIYNQGSNCISSSYPQGIKFFRDSIETDFSKVSEIRLKLVQLWTEKLKGVKARGPTQVLMS